MTHLDRRAVLGLLGVAVASCHSDAQSSSPEPVQSAQAERELLVLNVAEVAFVSAVVDAIVPMDELTPSGTECGIVHFIDRQLAGAWGAGARSYRSPPFVSGKAEFGPQDSLTPLEYFRAGLLAVNRWTKQKFGAELDLLSPEARITALAALEDGSAAVVGIDPKVFFEQMLRMTLEGMFSDPIYGGNRNKVAWQMLGYPGLPALYSEHVRLQPETVLHLASRSIRDFS